MWNLFCIHILVFQILENDSNIKREEEDQDKITLGSRQSDIKNPKEKSGCCWYLIKTCMNEHIVNMSWMSELYSRVFWVASQTCLLFRLLKEVMWTSFLILWLYMCSTHLIVMHCVWQSSTYWLTDTCICSFLQNHFVSLPFALKSITRDWRQSRWVLFFVSNFLSCASSACEIRERFWLLCSVTNRWIA